MDEGATADVFLFGDYRFDRRAGVLFRRDESGALAPADIGSRAVAVLDILVVRHGNLVSKEEIMQTAWPGTVVEENNLTVQISALRRVLDQGRSEGSYIQTVPRRGYRFTAPVTRVAAEMQSDAGSGAERLRDTSTGRAFPGRPPRHGRTVIGLAAGLMFVVVVASWWLGAASLSSRAVKTADRAPEPTPSAATVVPPLVAPRLSIVVLPFTNLSNDPGQEYFADGITEDLTTDLSRLWHMLVISRDTAFTYKDKPVNAKQIGRELGVRYVLEGSVQRSGDRGRVNAQLIDAGTDTHLWAERFDHDLGDLLALQSEITGRIANTLNIELAGLSGAEAARHTDHPEALDFVIRGRAAWSKPHSVESDNEAITLFEHALALDPRSVEAQSALAAALVARVLDKMNNNSESNDIARAEDLIRQVLAALPDNMTAHYAKGLLLRQRGRPDEAVFEFETVLATNPNSVGSLHNLGWCKWMSGSIDEVIPLALQAIRLSTRDPSISFFYSRIGIVHLLQSRTGDAIFWLEKARAANAKFGLASAFLAAAYALHGERDRAADELTEARRLSRGDRYASLARVKAAGFSGSRNYWGVPKVRALFEATYFDGLRKAGMPEE
jgi:adenylate cyclase